MPAGKTPADYQVPERYRSNFADVLDAKIRKYGEAGCLPPYPSGNGFCEQELILARALERLKAKMGHKVGTMSGGLLNVIKGGEAPARAGP